MKFGKFSVQQIIQNAACGLFCFEIKTKSEYGQLRQAAVKIVGKQDPQDAEYLMKALHLTAAQADLVCNHIGCSDDDEEEYKAKHRGEMCVIDNNKVEFIKVDMIRSTERLSVETSSEEIKKLYKIA